MAPRACRVCKDWLVLAGVRVFVGTLVNSGRLATLGPAASRVQQEQMVIAEFRVCRDKWDGSGRRVCRVCRVSAEWLAWVYKDPPAPSVTWAPPVTLAAPALSVCAEIRDTWAT